MAWEETWVFCGYDCSRCVIPECALYQYLRENGLEAVIRLKDKRRILFQEAEGLFNRGEGKKKVEV